MTFLFPFHAGDIARAEQWLRWVEELGGCRSHAIVLMPAKQVDDFATARELAEKAFGSVSVLHDAEGISGHPEGPNSVMRQAVWHCQLNKIGPWTFIETDCIPLVPDWADLWEREYRAFARPFMGELRPANGVIPDYLTGNMVLPADAITLAPMLTRRGLSRDGVELAFDIVSAGQVLPQAHLTKLLQQEPKHPDGSSISFPTPGSLKLLRHGAVLFHPCKDGTLIERLRELATTTIFAGESAQSMLSIPAISNLPRVMDMSMEPGQFPKGMGDVTATEKLLRAENKLLLERIEQLEVNLAEKAVLKTLKSRKPKKKHSAIEQARINVRMAKLRARKKLAVVA